MVTKEIKVLIVISVAICFIAGLVYSYTTGYLEGLHEGSRIAARIAQFRFYYVKPEQRFGVDALIVTLKGLEWITAYREGVFDCSEMSAYLEWHLENRGWHTVIVGGHSPFGEGRHTWLLVETSPDRWLPVDATTIQAVLPESPHFDAYFKYDLKFETIQDALAYNEDEFDWWSK